jgi:hypothetical protein
MLEPMFELTSDPPMIRSALVSRCGNYRYMLKRIWDRRAPQSMVNFVLLNPSTADGEVDDPTVRRCIGFARRWGFGGIIITNLFGLRSTDPAALRIAPDPIGPRNDESIADAVGCAALTVAAWGIHGHLLGRDRAVLALVRGLEPAIEYFGATRCGAPLHPLYLRSSHSRQPFPVKSDA